MSEDLPLPRQVKVVDTKTLLALEASAGTLELNQRLMLKWLTENVNPAGGHYLWPALWHRYSHRPEVSPHLRCELLLRLLDGEQVVSLLDVMPDDFETLPAVRSRSEGMEVRELLDSARTVRERIEGISITRRRDSTIGHTFLAPDE
ncbi:hypothetical protein [Streptomyces mirabilis]